MERAGLFISLYSSILKFSQFLGQNAVGKKTGRIVHSKPKYISMDRKIFLYSIIASVFASIGFSWLLEPLTKWIWHAASDTASSWLVELQSAAFVNAALGKRDWVSTIILIFGFVLFVGTQIGFLSVAIFGQRLAALSKSGKIPGWVRRSLKASFAIAFLYTTNHCGRLMFLAYVDLQLNASFSQRLDALGPHIEQLDERRLKSEWALMRSREDYDRINQHIDQLAIAAKVTVPIPLY